MRPVRDIDVETAYKLTCDISDTAKSLIAKDICDPFSIQIVWQNFDENYECLIDVSVKPKNKI